MHLPPIATLEPFQIYSSLLSSSPTPSPPISSLPTSSLIHALPLPPNLPAHQLEPLAGHLYPTTLIHLSTTTQLILKTAPSPNTFLLRHERLHLASEVTLLALLSKSRSLPTPRLLNHSFNSFSNPPALNTTTRPFILITQLPGIPYALVRPYLTRAEHRSIGRQLRALRVLAASQYTSHTFGPPWLVAEGRGFLSWKEAFDDMIANILMDAEDMLVALPYGEIRAVVRRMGPELEAVREARLVLGFGAGSRDDGDEGDWDDGVAGGLGVGVLIDRRKNEVAGLVGLGAAVWGDSTWGDDHHGYGKGALYAIYASLVTIVTNHYRPSRDSQELDARKCLTSALRRLAENGEGEGEVGVVISREEQEEEERRGWEVDEEELR